MIYILIGLLSGIISGMGIGGGTFLIPVLTIFMDYSQIAAQRINLIYFIPTAIFALIFHLKNNNIEKTAVNKLVLFGITGAVVGASLASYIDSRILRRLFAVFLLIMGIKEFYRKKQIQEKTAFKETSNKIK
ncbi:MAG: sulfite exporter TauE/SafE family protein [Firmicutes bacterium]|nr:sulfite exporter TauE/SafE family protein [Bacillota bacterium]